MKLLSWQRCTKSHKILKSAGESFVVQGEVAETHWRAILKSLKMFSYKLLKIRSVIETQIDVKDSP